ncbi:MAG: type II toxin-antitoxin system VapB family antitoxin [Alphaproteobacteria bacterium]|nr:type II toxin-antitoxin system VapB family antitoxin [Alphaproteobacteria bacterium]
MALHITDPRSDKLARELARATGESLTQAVTKALEERLSRVGKRKAADVEKMVAEMTRIARSAKGLRKLKKSSRELVEELYDEDGLPR